MCEYVIVFNCKEGLSLVVSVCTISNVEFKKIMFCKMLPYIVLLNCLKVKVIELKGMHRNWIVSLVGLSFAGGFSPCL